jgi:hypothetical protein
VSEMDIHDQIADDTEADLQTDLEAPEADVVEQHQVIRPDGPRFDLDHVPLDADEADVTEQSQAVALDEDDYR